jgi:glycosyltransferase involved in cell wall biosynthesis
MGMNDEIHKHDYTFIVPCYNELKNLPRLISEISSYTKSNSDCKFILVENGSTDDSRNFLKSLEPFDEIQVVYLDQNKGYGGGIWEGIKLSESNMTGWFHADLQIPFKDVISIKDLSKKEESSVKGKRINRPMLDTLLTFGMSIFCSLLFASKLEDINGQPTIYTTDILRKNVSPPLDFSLDLYFYLAARKEKIDLVRPRVKMVERNEGVSSWNNGFRSRLRMITRTLKYAIQLRLRNQID